MTPGIHILTMLLFFAAIVWSRMRHTRNLPPETSPDTASNATPFAPDTETPLSNPSAPVQPPFTLAHILENPPREFLDLLRFWAWETLLPLGGQRQFVGEHGFENENVAWLLDTHRWFDSNKTYQPVKAREKLRLQYQTWMQEHDFENIWTNGLPGVLKENLTAWQKLLNLSEAEVRLLGYTVLLHSVSLLADLAQFLGELNGKQTIHTLAQLLKQPESAIQQALSRDGQLFLSGLVRIDNQHDYYLRSKLDIMSGSFADMMVNERISPLEMLKRHIRDAPHTELALADFAHMGDLVNAMRHYLQAALDKKQHGCNILLYGMAGTGKTEFSRVLAQSLGVPLYEIAWADNEGDPASREARMSALRAAQHIFAHQKLLLLFDEIEDVFEQEQEHYSLNKAWINRMLETNKVPTLWISNSVDDIDRAILRRFDIIMEMKSPPRKHRAQMIGQYAQNWLQPGDIRQLAEHETVVPALLERAHKVTEMTADHFDNEQKGRLFKNLLHNTLKAQGLPSQLNTRSKLPEVYDLKWINTTQNLEKIAQGLQKSPQAGICLYGPPGTGKSAWVKWLADSLNKPLIYKRGSDLLSKYVGESEQQIAAAFEEAARDEAVLIFDEVDSFLQDRRSATRSWEITQVNEMLTQMEAFNGIFVATTNLIKHLDQAALRRFDFKIEFGYLKPEQAWGLFEQHCRTMKLDIAPTLEAQVKKIGMLTPGDFAVAAQRARIAPFRDAAEMLKLLKSECALKEGANKGSFGFL